MKIHTVQKRICVIKCIPLRKKDFKKCIDDISQWAKHDLDKKKQSLLMGASKIEKALLGGPENRFLEILVNGA